MIGGSAAEREASHDSGFGNPPPNHLTPWIGATRMFWLLASFAIPVYVAVQDGSTYTFAGSLIGIGVILYFVNLLLIRHFLLINAPGTIEDGSWEATAGTGAVPRWVSALGLIAVGLVPAGIVVALLLFFGVVVNRGL